MHQVWFAAPDGHEVDDPDGAGRRLEFRFEHHRRAGVLPPAGDDLALRGDEPAPMFRTAQERGKAGARIEPRQTQPVDRPVPADERRHNPRYTGCFERGA